MTTKESHEARLSLVDQHREKKDQVAVENYSVTRNLIPIDSVTHGVTPPFSQYSHLTVQIRTSNESRKMRERPYFVDPPDLVEARDAMLALPVDAPERDAMVAAYLTIRNHYQVESNLALARWLPLFVKGIDGWNYSNNDEPIPAPTPSDPSTYDVLYFEFEDLFDWLVDDKGAYAEALKLAIGKN